MIWELECWITPGAVITAPSSPMDRLDREKVILLWDTRKIKAGYCFYLFKSGKKHLKE